MYVPIRKAREITGLSGNTLRKYADEGKYKAIRTPGGNRLFDTDSFSDKKQDCSLICYCRVSSTKQKDDLARQVAFMRNQFPESEIIKDIGSGLNFKRQGLRTILDRANKGYKLTVIVTHRDRLCRFGFDLIEYVIKQNGGEIMVLDRVETSPQSELTEDILAILHHFSCRMHGLRRYTKAISEDKDIPKQNTDKHAQGVDWCEQEIL